MFGVLNSLLHKDAKQRVASPHGSSALRSKAPFSFYSYPNPEKAFYFTPPQVFITFLKGSLEILPPISTSVFCHLSLILCDGFFLCLIRVWCIDVGVFIFDLSACVLDRADVVSTVLQSSVHYQVRNFQSGITIGLVTLSCSSDVSCYHSAA